jgi:hypothetical protein
MNCPAIKCNFNITLLIIIINLYYIIIKKKYYYLITWTVNILNGIPSNGLNIKKKTQKVYYRCGEILSDGIRHSDGTLALAATLTAHRITPPSTILCEYPSFARER